ncbi:MAG TPA: IS66 family insertion sequence element accessory protein TnpB [Prosthecobacter sp.]|nr:IS66 family insertion sequence element accessory protein TnpB [Prosthecobacter sp.]
MIAPGPATRVFLAAGATDLRKSFEGLASLVRHRLEQDPLSGHLFVFANGKRTRLKILYFDGTGTWVCAKRLERGTFNWPITAATEGAALRILAEELVLLISGIDLEKSRERNWWRKAA